MGPMNPSSFKNKRVVHLCFALSYIALGLTGVLFSFIGWLGDIHNEFHLFFTNQSNILAVLVSIGFAVSAFLDLKSGKKEGLETRFVNSAFCMFVYQGVTMILYNAFMWDAHLFTAKFWSTVQCPVLHLFAPLSFLFLFIAFFDKSKLKSTLPLLILIYPFLYSAFILIRSLFYLDAEPFQTSGIIVFPYPIYDYQTYGGFVILFLLGGLILFFVLAYFLVKAFRKTKSIG